MPHTAVCVTGAGGRTGRILVRKLLADSRCEDGTFAYNVGAVVRSKASEEKLLAYLRECEACDADGAVEKGALIFPLVDITSDAAEADLAAALKEMAGPKGSVGLVVSSSAVPSLNVSSLPGVIFWNKMMVRRHRGAW